MGSRGVNITQGEANGSEMRTPPLWGLRLMTTFVHDGRVTTIGEAILAHDGHGLEARERCAALPATQQEPLLVFLRSC